MWVHVVPTKSMVTEVSSQVLTVGYTTTTRDGDQIIIIPTVSALKILTTITGLAQFEGNFPAWASGVL